MDWTDLIKLFFIAAFPWISELRNLDIHFEQPNIKTSVIFNFFASLFAMGIFVYSFYVNPYQLIQLPRWGFFLLFAGILTIIFFTLFIYNKEAVKNGKRKGVVVFQFIIYILIFCSLTTCFGLLRVFKEYVVIHGKITDSEKKPTIADFSIKFKDDPNHLMTFRSHSDGKYTVMIKTKDIDKVERIEAKNNSGESFEINTFGEISVFDYLNEVQLVK